MDMETMFSSVQSVHLQVQARQTAVPERVSGTDCTE